MAAASDRPAAIAAVGASAVTAIVVATPAEPAIIERRVNPPGSGSTSVLRRVTMDLLCVCAASLICVRHQRLRIERSFRSRREGRSQKRNIWTRGDPEAARLQPACSGAEYQAMILIATALGMFVGALGGAVMHHDFRSELGVDRHRAVVGGIVFGGLTGLLGAATLFI
jgi:hypothetical protein